MRSALLVFLALPLFAGLAPAKSPKEKALAAIKTIVTDLPLGTPFETVKQREDFKLLDDIGLSSARIEGVAFIMHFHNNKISRLVCADLKFAHPELLEFIVKEYGKPVTRTVDNRTTHVFTKEGKGSATLSIVPKRMTQLELSVPEK